MFDESTYYSLGSKRFRVVSEQRKTEERRGTDDFWFWPRGKRNESQELKWGRGWGKGRKP